MTCNKCKVVTARYVAYGIRAVSRLGSALLPQHGPRYGAPQPLVPPRRRYFLPRVVVEALTLKVVHYIGDVFTRSVLRRRRPSTYQIGNAPHAVLLIISLHQLEGSTVAVINGGELAKVPIRLPRLHPLPLRVAAAYVKRIVVAYSPWCHKPMRCMVMSLE